MISKHSNKYERRIREGWKAKKMFAPVKLLTPRQYQLRKNREFKTAEFPAADPVHN